MMPDRQELEELITFLEEQYIVTPGLARAIEILGMIRDEEVKLSHQLHIGDQMEWDIMAIKEFGMRTARLEVVDIQETDGLKKVVMRKAEIKY